MAPLVALAIKIIAPLVVREAAERVIWKEEKEKVMNEAVKGAAVSKTMWFAFILAVLGLLEQYQGLFVSLIGAEHMGKVLLFVAAVSAVLRVLTRAPLAEKGK